MAAADDASSTIVWISLRDAFAALKLALSAYGSETLAEELLVQWIGTGKIPWDCELWEGPNAEWIAGWEEFNSQLKFRRLAVASPAWRKGDPEWFLRANLEINFQESKARDTAIGGAKASGIKISHTHSLACLDTLAPQPAKPLERKAPEQTTPAEREKMGPDEWQAWARKEYPQQRNEKPIAYLPRLHGLMQKADNVTEVWIFPTFRRRYDDAVKAEKAGRQAVQKARNAHKRPPTD